MLIYLLIVLFMNKNISKILENIKLKLLLITIYICF